MNKEQAKSLVRWVITACGASLATWAAMTGWASADTILAILNSEWFIGAAATIVALVWSMFTHTEANAVATVAAIPDPSLHAAGVAKILVTKSELASASPGDVVQQVANPSASTGFGRRAS